MRLRKLFKLLGLGAVCVLGVAQAARGTGPAAPAYDDLILMQLALQSLPQQQHDKLIVKTYIQQMGICDWGCAPLKVWVTSGGKRIDLPVENGVVTGMLDPDLAGKGLFIQSNSPLHLRLDAYAEIRPPSGVDVPASYFSESLTQLNKLIVRVWRRKKGFIRALFAPEAESLTVYFARADKPVQLDEGATRENLPDAPAGTGPVILKRAFLRSHAGSILHFPGPINEVTVGDQR